MTIAILGIVSALVPFVIWLWKRKTATDDNPQTQHETRIQTTDESIAKGAAGVDDLNRALSDFDRKLPDGGASGPDSR